LAALVASFITAGATIAVVKINDHDNHRLLEQQLAASSQLANREFVEDNRRLAYVAYERTLTRVQFFYAKLAFDGPGTRCERDFAEGHSRQLLEQEELTTGEFTLFASEGLVLAYRERVFSLFGVLSDTAGAACRSKAASARLLAYVDGPLRLAQESVRDSMRKDLGTEAVS